MAFNIIPPKNIAHLFVTWLSGIDKTNKTHIRVGVCALLCAVWNVRNCFVFNKTSICPLCRLSRWQHIGFVSGPFSSRQPVEHMQNMVSGCNRLKMGAHDYLTSAVGVLRIDYHGDAPYLYLANTFSNG
jgi:hypothetical protein